MKGLGFEVRIAARHLSAGRGQTVLTLSTVAAGVTVIIFIASLIYGLRQMFTNLLTDLLPQVTITPPEPKPVPLRSLPGVEKVSARIETQNPQRKLLDNWPSMVAAISKMPHVVSVAPAVLDSGVVSRGGRQLGVTVYGADPQALSEVISIRKYITQGHYLGLGPDQAVISYKLGDELGIGLGDRIRLTSNLELSSSFTIVGIYDNGSDEQRYSAYIPLRSAQSLYKTGTSVRTILVKTDDLFNADRVADEIAAVMPYKVDSWSRQNPQFLTSLAMQTVSAFLISGFSLMAAGFAIASVLVVSVLQKSKQIGILKSMGATQTQIFRVFLLEGFGIAIAGSILGALVGIGFVEFLDLFKRPWSRGAMPTQMFPTELSVIWISAAMASAIVSTIIASVLPARRAASMDPVQVMR